MLLPTDLQDEIEHLDADERRWLEAIYAHYQAGEMMARRGIKADLWGEIARDFDPSRISPLFLEGNGKLTPFGVLAIHPEADVLEKIDRIIFYVRDRLIEDPDLEQIETVELADALGLPERAAAFLLALLATLGRYVSGGGLYSDGKVGYRSIGVGQDDTFDAYYRYEGIEALVRDWFHMRKEQLDAGSRVSGRARAASAQTPCGASLHAVAAGPPGKHAPPGVPLRGGQHRPEPLLRADAVHGGVVGRGLPPTPRCGRVAAHPGIPPPMPPR